jgi:hypothetical protein
MASSLGIRRAPASRIAAGAYGLALRGLESAAHLLVAGVDTWQPLDVLRRVGTGSAQIDRLGDERAEVAFEGGGQVVIEREPAQAIFTLPRPLSDEELVHPYLAPLGVIAGYWSGRESFHAGTFLLNEGAWALVGDRGAGKSSLLAWLSLEGREIVADDILVLDDGNALAGPRAVDLRAGPARRLGAGEPLGVVGARERWRLTTGSVAAEAPLRGWIFLRWGDRVEMERLPGGRRVPELARHRALRVPPKDPRVLVELAGLPAWELRRPRRWASLGEAGARLVEVLAG